MKEKIWFIWLSAFMVVLALSACGETNTKENGAKKETSYTADNVYSWLKESGLIKGEAKDKTAEMKGTKGLVKAIGTGEVDIHEFKTAEQAKKYDTGGDLTVAYKNIYILIIQGQSQHDNFKKVLEAGKPIKNLTVTYTSEQQKQVAELMKNGSDFFPLVEAYYNLPNDQKTQTYEDFIAKKEVTWTGIIADRDALSSSLVLYGNPQGYNGENWITMSTDKEEMMPYVIVVKLKDKAMKNGLNNGDHVKVKGIVSSRGDKTLKFNWKLIEGEVVK